MIALLPLAALLGAFGRRIAGGILNQWTGHPDSAPLMGDIPARLIFGSCIAAGAAMGGAIWWHALALIPAVWAGTTVGNFGSISQGRGGGSPWSQALGELAHGLAGVALPALGAWWLGYPHWWVLPIGGALIAPSYWLGWTVSGLYGRPDFPVGLRGGSEIGEALWGACFGCAALLAAWR